MIEQDIIKYFKQYNIDIINDDIIQIKNVKIPNFYHWPDTILDLKYEFCHLLYKNYYNYLEHGYVHYENNQYKISPKDIVIDCGGNMGIFSAYAAAQGAKVYAFEPMSYVRSMLKETQKLYPHNIEIIPYALGKENIKTKFNQCRNPGGSHYAELHENNGNDILYTEMVQILKLDDFIWQYQIKPTFIKADIEGSEELMIQGGVNCLQQYKPILSIAAYHFNNNINNLIKYIKNINQNYQIELYENNTYIFGR